MDLGAYGVLIGTEESWARPLELAAAKKTSKTGFASLKPAGLLFFGFFLSNSSLLFFHYPYITHFISIFVSLFFLFSLLCLTG